MPFPPPTPATPAEIQAYLHEKARSNHPIDWQNPEAAAANRLYKPDPDPATGFDRNLSNDQTISIEKYKNTGVKDAAYSTLPSYYATGPDGKPLQPETATATWPPRPLGTTPPAEAPTTASQAQAAAAVPGPIAAQGDSEVSKAVDWLDPKYTTADGFFVADMPADGAQWSKLYPYQLKILYAKTGGGYNVMYSYTLPIAPMELAVRTPFAIQTTVTLRGILEEHGGAPLRQISFSGTTGVWKLRPTVERPTTSGTGIAESIAGGTISAIGRVNPALSRLWGGVSSDSTNTSSDSQKEEGIQGTGYWQFHMLQLLLERYALTKKGSAYMDPAFAGTVPDPSRLRLAFCMWKDNWVWLITPKMFSLTRSANDPMVYRYAFEATAWKKIDLADPGQPEWVNGVAVNDPSALMSAMNTLQAARQTVQQGRSIIEAVRSDIRDSVFNNLREGILFIKDIIGIPAALIDMPGSIVKDFQGTVISEWESLRASLPGGATVRQDPSNPSPTGARFEVTRGEQVGKGTARSQVDDTADPLNNVFNDPEGNSNLFNNIEISSMDVPYELSRRVDGERQRVASLERQDFEKKRADFLSVSNDLAARVGLASATYNRVAGLEPPTAVAHESTPDELDVLFALQQSAQVMDGLTANYALKDSERPNSFEYVKGLADAADIAFDIPRSKYSVPLPYGFTLEQLALQYLGDPDRWAEIVTLNGLRPPYIDEVGFTYPLLTNGSGSQVVVGSKENLYVGQTVRLYSAYIPTFKRRVVNIEEISPTNILLTLDGDPDLESLTTAQAATLKAYLPGTLNSEQLVFIPSQAQGPEETKYRPASTEADADMLTKVSKVDLLLDSFGDIIVTPTGEAKLSFGLTNLIQAARLKMGTQRGSLLRYPSYGFGIEPGVSTADITAQQVLQSAQSSFRGDDRFTGVRAMEVKKRGNSLSISMLVGASGAASLLPVTIEVRG